MGRFAGWTLGIVFALAISVAPAAAQSWSVGVHIGGGPVYGPYYGPAPYYAPAPYYGPDPYYSPPAYYPPVYAAPVYRQRVYYPAYGPYYYGSGYRGGYYGSGYRGGAVVVRGGNGNGRYYNNGNYRSGGGYGRGPAQRGHR